MITIGSAIKKARKSKGYSQEKLAKKTGVAMSTIKQWEIGKTFPNIINLIPIADLFGLTLDELVGREVSK